MELEQAMTLAARGMRAQGVRMRVISENLANAETAPRKPGEAPYRRQVVTFKNELDKADQLKKVKIDKIIPDKSDFVLKYDPGHPAANAEGYVSMPNVNTLVEMMDMREAQRSYQANLGAIEVSRAMLMKTIDLMRAN